MFSKVLQIQKDHNDAVIWSRDRFLNTASNSICKNDPKAQYDSRMLESPTSYPATVWTCFTPPTQVQSSKIQKMGQINRKHEEQRETHISGLGITMLKRNSEKQGLDYSQNPCRPGHSIK